MAIVSLAKNTPLNIQSFILGCVYVLGYIVAPITAECTIETSIEYVS